MPSKAISLRRELLLSSSPEELWPLLSNTNRFNKALGLPAVRIESVSRDYSLQVRARLWGLPMSWRELPFEWAEGRFYRAFREFSSGPLERFEGGIELSREGGGCRLRLAYEFFPRNALGSLLARSRAGPRLLSRAEALIRGLDSELKSRGEPFPQRRSRSSPYDSALARKAETLGKAPLAAPVRERLISHIRWAYDDELSRMRPFELADLWGLERLEVLRAFLHSVKAGLLDMSWELLCPNCSAATERIASLSALKNSSHCPACEADYGVNFDETVELRFSVSPTVRPVVLHVHCVGNPSQTPFAVAQVSLAPGKARVLELELGPESYLFRNLTAKAGLRLRPSAEGPSEIALESSLSREQGEVSFRPGGVRLILQAGQEPVLARLEREGWKEKGAKASLVTMLQEFRDLFSSEVLSPGVEIAVKNVAILFSDLKGSTALYERIGDATAYALVRDHFDYLFEIVRRRRGAVVKTIGDAVMAVFPSGADALEAALETQERVGELNARLAPKPAVVIKLGVHQGPAIAINAGGLLDYFGTVVNVSARVQNESQGGDVVTTEALVSEAAALEALARHPARRESFSIQLKGLSEVFRLWRLVPG